MNKFDSIFSTKDFLKKLFEASVDGIAIIDEKGNILGVNPAFARIYGYTREELENMHISQLADRERVPEEFLEKHLKMISEVQEKGGSVAQEAINRRKDGSKIFIESSYTLLRHGGGNDLGGLIIIRDITNKKTLEKELKESEEKYRELFETANDGIILTDKNNRIITINKRAEEILGYSREEVMEKPATILMPARYQKRDENAMERVFSTGQSYTVGKTFEIGIVKKDGSEILAEATYSVLKRGDDFTFTMIFRDISERKNLEARLIQSERLNALGGMASGIAHDFNNLLAIILGRIQFLKFKLGSYQGIERRQFSKYLLDGLDIIEKAATDGAEAVRRIQEFTRVKTDTENFTEISINDVVNDVIEYTKPLWKDEAETEGRRISIIKHLSNTLLPVEGNPSELREVLLNIIKNALDAMPDGGTIFIKTSLDYGFVLLSIGDTGYGMSKESKEKIFDPFFTTKGPQHMGLGMSVAYGIMKRHHGDITVKSEEGKGTCVTIKLPVTQGMSEKKKTTTPPAEEKKARILVIDDEEGVRKLLFEFLQTVGHDVAIASDGEEGLKLFKDGNYDMVFTDLGMPGISGWEVAKKVKEINSRVSVVLITGWGIQLDEEKKRTHGVDFVISKPFHIDQVISLVQEGILKTHLT